MNPFIFSLTIGQIAGQKRTIVMLLFGGIPVLFAVIFRFAAEADANPVEAFAAVLVRLIVGLILPLVALVFGTAALGQDLEDGTAIYLLGKPVPRWRIVIEKAAAAWVVTALVGVTSVVATGIVLLAGEGDYQAIPAFAIAVALGSLAYGALFICLSVFFNRALIIGLVYVFVWEAVISAVVDNLQYVSVRGFTLGIAHALADISVDQLDVSVGPIQSFVLLLVVAAAAIAAASWRLASFEVGDQT